MIVAHTIAVDGFESSAPGSRRKMRNELMKRRHDRAAGDLRPEYDLRQVLKGAVRGKYAKRYRGGTNLILLDPDVRKAFRNERAINDALRLAIELRKVGSGTQISRFECP